MKSDKGRFDDAIKFIRDINKAELAEHLIATAKAAKLSESTLGADLSVGSRPGKKSDPDWDDDTKKRRALRSLLLCQRVYFSKAWAHVAGQPPASKVDAWPNNDWSGTRDASIAHWSTRSEADVTEAVLAFSITSAKAENLATAATAPGDALLTLPDVRVSRANDPFPGHKTCYSAIMYWLFRSGIVSYRWMMKNWGTPAPAGLRALFGPAKIIWAADKPFGDDDAFPAVPKGFIVHLYVDTPAEFGGHWLVSDGKGGGYGRNNDQEGGLVAREYALCNLKRQFLAYKGTQKADKSGVERVTPGIAEIIDPTKIPNRI